MVDIHCHIIPEVDDGAKDWDVAAEMCRMAYEDGVRHIVATPHANGEYSYNREAHEERLARLREIAAGTVQFSLGCDFHFSYDNIQDALANPYRYSIGNTRYLLVEFSDFALPPRVDETLAELMGAGFIPVITHPERNPILQRKPQMVVNWSEMGAVVQVTANSVTGRWGRDAKKTIDFLLKNRSVHVLASDAHGTRDRTPILSEARDAMAKAAGEEVAMAMVEYNPQAIVAGEPLPYR